MPANLVIINDKKAELTLHQGKFHQVKRMFKRFDYDVITLERKAFAFLTVEDLKQGEYRELTPKEEIQLKEIVG